MSVSECVLVCQCVCLSVCVSVCVCEDLYSDYRSAEHWAEAAVKVVFTPHDEDCPPCCGLLQAKLRLNVLLSPADKHSHRLQPLETESSGDEDCNHLDHFRLFHQGMKIARSDDTTSLMAKPKCSLEIPVWRRRWWSWSAKHGAEEIRENLHFQDDDCSFNSVISYRLPTVCVGVTVSRDCSPARETSESVLGTTFRLTMLSPSHAHQTKASATWIKGVRG